MARLFFVPCADRRKFVKVTCKCGKEHKARMDRGHDLCPKCAKELHRKNQIAEIQQELEPWQVTMYLDAMARNECAMPWEKRKIR